MKYVHHRPPGPDAGGLPGGWDTHNGLAEPYFTLSQRHRGKSHGPASVLRPGGVRRIICFGMGLTLREGNREYFFSQLDRHFPGLSDRYRRCYGSAYEVVSPRGRALMSLMEGFCREQGICMDLQENFHFLREFPNKLEERQMKLW